MSEKKPKIPLAEQHRALHAAINMTEKRWSDVIDNAPTGKTEELETRKAAHLAALEALQKTWDFVIEFPDEFRIFVKELAEKRAQKKAAE